MFKRILIANRGEPAIRVIRSCRELGIETILVYSEIDRDTLPVKLADRSVCIGPAPAADSYLNIPRILSAAEITGAEAIHPGTDFLAESVELAETVEACKLQWIGPRAETMRKLSDRILTRKLARELGIPLLPGSEGETAVAADARKLADEIGYPVILKPARSSGKCRVVRKDRDLETAVRMAQAEAKAATNDNRVYLERYLENARDIEVSILGDAQGNVLHLCERESSIQHRQQKIMDEAPSPMAGSAVRARLCDWAVQLGRAAGYQSAGSIEFIADEAGNPYFQDFHLSLQPSHPVSEVMLGCDLVAEQMRIAAGLPIAWQNPVGPDGVLPPETPHVIQCRIDAEDADKEFMPTSGVVTLFRIPGGPGVRVDTHTFNGYRGSAQYDTLVAKIIVWDADREKAIARMERALQETAIEGVKTTLEFHQKILRLGAFRKGELSTSLIDREVLGLH
jgi:acetyl-CoA carboxylase, biotin carboxylase subunit